MDKLIETIYRAENGGKINYDVIYGGVPKSAYPSKPLTQMTVKEVYEWQMANYGKWGSTASGAVQIIPETLKSSVKRGSIGWDDKFDAEGQNKITLGLLEKRGLSKWQSGKMSTEDFGTNLAKEWASLPVLKTTSRNGKTIPYGNAYYGGVSTNRSTAAIPASSFRNVLGGGEGFDARNANLSTSGGADPWPDNTAVYGTTSVLEGDMRERMSEQFEGVYPDPYRHMEPWEAPEEVDLRGPQYGVDASMGEFETERRAPQLPQGRAYSDDWTRSFNDGFVDSGIYREVKRRNLEKQYEFDMGFNPIEAIKADGLQEHYKLLGPARNKEHYDRLKREIMIQGRRADRMQQWDGYGAHTLGMMTNPDAMISMAVPFLGMAGAVARGGLANFGRAALYTGGAVGGAEAGLERIRAANDPFSTQLDSITRVGGAAVFSGLLGGAFGTYAGLAARRSLGDDVIREIGELRGVGKTTTKVDVGPRKADVAIRQGPIQPSNGRRAAQGAKGPTVEMIGDQIVVNEARLVDEFTSGRHTSPATSVQEYMEFEIARVAAEAKERFAASPSSMKGEGVKFSEAKTHSRVEANGEVSVDRAAIKKSIDKGETLALGAAKGSKNVQQIEPVLVNAKAFKTVEEAEKAIFEASRLIGLARDSGEFRRMLQSSLGKDIVPDVAPLTRQQKVRAEVEARQKLQEIRQENNKIIRSKVAEGIARMTDGPFKRVHRNAISGATRDIVNKLAADGGFLMMADKTGMTTGPSVYSRAHTWQGVTRRMWDKEEELYVKMLGLDKRQTFADLRKPDVLARKQSQVENPITKEEFRDRVSKAYITKTKDDIPEIMEMVENLRGAYDEYKVAGEQYGVLDHAPFLRKQLEAVNERMLVTKDDTKIAKMESIAADLQRRIKIAEDGPNEDYFTRVWSRKKIEANREAFKERVIKPWMKQQNVVHMWTPGKDDLGDLYEDMVRVHGPDSAQATKVRKQINDPNTPEFSTFGPVKMSTKPAAIEARAEKFLQNILDEAEPESLSVSRTANRPVFGRERQFQIPNSHLLKDGPNGNGIDDFIETDYMLVQYIYSQRMGPAIEMNRTFGRPVDGVSGAKGLREALAAAKAKEKSAWDMRKQRGGERRRYNEFERKNPKYRKILNEMGLEHIKMEELPMKHRHRIGGAYSRSEKTIYINPERGSDIGTVYHEAMHAVFEEANLAKKFVMAFGLRKTKDFEPALNIKNKYQPEWKKRRADGQILVETDEYIAQVFGYWATRGKEGGMADFLEAANKHAAKKGRPLIELSDAELKSLDQAFLRLKTKGIEEFETHWAKIERDILDLERSVTNRAVRNVDRMDNRAATAMKNLASLAYMGGSVLPATTEIGMLIMRHGAKRMWQEAFGELDEGMRAARKMAVGEMRAAGALMEVVDGIAIARAAETGMESTVGTAPERWLRTNANKYFLWNGLAPLSTRLREIDGQLRVHDMVSRIKRVSDLGLKGADEADIEELARWGISYEDAVKMSKQPIDEIEGGGWLANTAQWDDENLVRTFRSALRQGSENTIMMATAADKPTIAKGTIYLRKGGAVDQYAIKAGLQTVGDYWEVQSGMLQLPFTFWNYAFAAHNKILAAGIDEPSAQKLGGIAAMLGIGYMVASIRNPDWKWDSMSADEKLIEAVDQSGVLGVLSQAKGMYDQPERAFGAGPNAVGSIVGGAATGDLGMASNGLPYQNFILTKDLFDTAVGGLEGLTGLDGY